MSAVGLIVAHLKLEGFCIQIVRNTFLYCIICVNAYITHLWYTHQQLYIYTVYKIISNIYFGIGRQILNVLKKYNIFINIYLAGTNWHFIKSSFKKWFFKKQTRTLRILFFWPACLVSSCDDKVIKLSLLLLLSSS